MSRAKQLKRLLESIKKMNENEASRVAADLTAQIIKNCGFKDVEVKSEEAILEGARIFLSRGLTEQEREIFTKEAEKDKYKYKADGMTLEFSQIDENSEVFFDEDTYDDSKESDTEDSDSED